MQALTIQLQESSPTLTKMSEVKLKRDKRSLIVSVMLFPARRYRGCLSSLTLRANRRNLVDHWTPNIVGCYMLRPCAHPVACCWMLLRVVAQSLKPIKLFAPSKRTQPLLAYNSQHCWMLHVASVCTSCCMLLDVVACCCAKFETDQTFRPEQTDATVVGLQLPTLLDVTCCVRVHILLHVVGCCCVLLRKVWNRSNFSPRANGRNIVGLQLPTLLGVVAPVCTKP